MKKFKKVLASFRWLVVLMQLFAFAKAQDFSIQLVQPFSRVISSHKLNKGQKASVLKDINNGRFKYPTDVTSDVSDINETVALRGENKIISFDVKNLGNKVLSKLMLSVDLPQSFQSKIFKQGAINDWYSNQNASFSQLNFYGDPLFSLEESGNSFILKNIKAGEKVRLVLEFNSSREFDGKMNIIANSGNVSKKAPISLKVYNKSVPSIEFSSIAYNANNFSTSSGVVNLMKETGFTHLQVNPVPSVLFKKDGSLLSQSIDQTTSSSKSFRDVAYNWIKNGGKVTLFWQPSYSKIAPTNDGSYLKPFTKEWINSFVNLLGQLKKELHNTTGSFRDEQLVVYLADEVSKQGLEKLGYSVKDLINLNNAIKKIHPNIKTLVTFGIYSNESDFNALATTVDIPVIHAVMPSHVSSRGIQYSPIAVKKAFNVLKAQRNLKNAWQYNVESGLTADLRDFRFLPSVSAAGGCSGFSWWAFSSHRGSTWAINKNNGLNYSFYYTKEVDNKIYQSVTEGLPSQLGLISSMRLKAARAGLIDAKVILAIAQQKNKLKSSDLSKFNAIIEKMKSYNTIAKDNLSLPQLSDIEKDANTLRTIYVTL